MRLQSMRNASILLGLAFAVSSLAVTSARADVATVYGDRDAYMSAVGALDWTFGTFQQISDDKSPRLWNFTMLNDGTYTTGMLTMSDFNGAGGLMQEPQGGEGTMTFWHNSANNYGISFGDAEFVDSFYMSVAPHSSWSAAITFGMTADYWLDGVKYTTEEFTIDMNNAFFGIVLDEGAYLTGINFWSTGTPNNGYKIEAGFGDVFDPSTPAVTPEPASMFIFGLGAAGLGLATARRRKKA